MAPILYTMFVIASFIMIIHLLNMLIAIMGNTFGERTEVSNLIQVRDHLKFVMDNWHENDTEFKNKDQIKYIITAFNQHEDQNQDENISELSKEIHENNDQTQKQIQRLYEGQTFTQHLVADLKKQMNKLNRK